MIWKKAIPFIGLLGTPFLVFLLWVAPETYPFWVWQGLLTLVALASWLEDVCVFFGIKDSEND